MPKVVHPRIGPALTVALLVLVVVAKAGLIIIDNPGWSAGEMQVVAAVHAASNPLLDALALTINAVFGPAGAAAIVLLGVAATLVLARSWRKALQFALVSTIPWLCAGLLKPLVLRPRPDVAQLQPMILTDPSSFSYPSGHVAFAAALTCAVILVFARRRVRAVAIAAGAVLVLATAWSRVYLGVHFPTDVLASIVLVPFAAIAVDRLALRWLAPGGGSTVRTGSPVGSSHGR